MLGPDLATLFLVVKKNFLSHTASWRVALTTFVVGVRIPAWSGMNTNKGTIATPAVIETGWPGLTGRAG